jgi:pyruvyl transferase EpsO
VTSPLADLQAQTREVLGRYLSPGDSVSLIDFPRHQNAGDSLIWRGEREYLQAMGVRVDFTANLHDFHADELRRWSRGPVLLSGGGNFGDRWERFQLFRESVVEAYPDRLIIQMPQSMDYRSPDALARTQRVYGAHERLVLLLRDQLGTAQATEAFPSASVHFCPDAALGVGSLGRLGSPRVDVLLLKRRDPEAKYDESSFPASWRRSEWGLTGVTDRLWRALRWPEDVAVRTPVGHDLLRPLISHGFEAQARLNVRMAHRMLSTARVVVTDRLHAMILAGLAGIPVVALDNSYGKVSRIYEDYVHRLPGVRFAASVEEAVALVDALRDAGDLIGDQAG